jgi:2-methylthioadenine synthetase
MFEPLFLLYRSVCAGPLRHRRREDILREVRDAVSRGLSEIFLLGQNVNSYRSGDKGDFVDLLEDAHAIEGVKEITFTSSHPRDSGIRLFKAVGGLERVKKWLHLPFQSGSDRVLKAMNRGYNSKYYLELAREYRRIVPGGELSTDVIVGFPGETEEDFQSTCRILEEVRFNKAYIFKYSPRPHSRAAEMEDDVPRREKERRHKLALDLQKRISLSGKQRRKAK